MSSQRSEAGRSPSLLRWSRLIWFCIFPALSLLSVADSSRGSDNIGTSRVMVLRVRFNDYDYDPPSRYEWVDVKGFLDEMTELWKRNSYGKLDVQFEVSDLYKLPKDRNAYIDDHDLIDSSTYEKWRNVLEDAVSNPPSGVTWDNVTAVLVVMAERDESQRYAGQGAPCVLPIGPYKSNKSVGCAVVSENPSESDLQVWGRWAHELGHNFQQPGGPAHPSSYRSEFELMDSNYPGQSGVFEKQAHTGFPDWLPEYKYITFNPTSGGGTTAIWASEHNPAGRPNPQAVKVEITEHLYYLVSVRRRILGDELNGDFQEGPVGQRGIPDEGVLIERVQEWPTWVKVIGRNANASCCCAPSENACNACCVATVNPSCIEVPDPCNRDKLWKENDTFVSGEGVRIKIAKRADTDNYVVGVSYADQASVPDVMLYPWRSPPGNTWETTDIWIDSPVNGYDTYRYGEWNDINDQLVPKGNGDDPAVGQVNRVYARVRNAGHAPATNVVVSWEVTDPPGVGINGATGWNAIGDVNKEDFPGLASIEAGSYVDVYVNWTPDFPVSPEDMAAGRFAFHTCLRVKLNQVPNETVFGNQDGDQEQENISYYQAPVLAQGEQVRKKYHHVLHLRNDERKKKSFLLSYRTDLPPDWRVDLNKDDHVVELGPSEVRSIPISISPGRWPLKIGSVFGTDVSASYQRLLVNDLDKTDVHIESTPLGGVRVETRVLKETSLACKVILASRSGYSVVGVLKGTEGYYPTKDRPLTVLVSAVDQRNRFRRDLSALAPVAPNGRFNARVKRLRRRYRPTTFVCMFAGTDRLMSAASGYIRLP
jgi:hypothetical protein